MDENFGTNLEPRNDLPHHETKVSVIVIVPVTRMNYCSLSARVTIILVQIRKTGVTKPSKTIRKPTKTKVTDSYFVQLDVSVFVVVSKPKKDRVVICGLATLSTIFSPMPRRVEHD